jgi:hypothetical protein
MYALLLILCSAHPLSLGAEDYETRERTEHRLRQLGPFGWPALLEAAEHSECAETRTRCARLLRSYERFSLTLRALTVLNHPDEPHYPTLLGDWRLRLRLYSIVRTRWEDVAASGHAVPLHPDNDDWSWWGGICVSVRLAEYVQQFRERWREGK